MPSLALAAVIIFLFCILLVIRRCGSRKLSTLPPGRYGWPFLGETLDFVAAGKAGEPEKFALERMGRYGSPVFKTSLFGDKMVVFCGSAGMKFLFANENKLVNQWWPSSVKRLLGRCLVNHVGDEAKRLRKMLMGFMNIEALARYIKIVDSMTRSHLDTHWEGKKVLKVYPTVKEHTFELACRLFLSLDDPQHLSYLMGHFFVFLKGVITLPLNFPGCSFYQSMKAANAIRKELKKIVGDRRMALEQKIASPTQDLLSHLIVAVDENGKHFTEEEIVSNILMLLFAGHDTSSSAITMIMKYLSEMPEVHNKVLEEQLYIASKKEPGELLDWADLQKMQYSWNVILEIMRLSPPVPGSFRQAIVDFNYEGYTIPKGWKILWSSAAQHRDPACFNNAATFDASRFEGAGPPPFSYVPFGGGPRMCLGMEFARLEILVFLHNVVTRYKWEKVFRDEKVVFDPMPVPAQGLPIHLGKHQVQ